MTAHVPSVRPVDLAAECDLTLPPSPAGPLRPAVKTTVDGAPLRSGDNPGARNVFLRQSFEHPSRPG